MNTGTRLPRGSAEPTVATVTEPNWMATYSPVSMAVPVAVTTVPGTPLVGVRLTWA